MKLAVLLSGGLDSSTALHWAAQQHEVSCALAFNYGSNHAAQELACARWQAESLGIPYHEIDIRSISQHLESALLNGADAIPDADYATENMKQTVVPFRNGIFLAIAAGVAESKGAQGIVIAAHSGDHSIYPDCGEPFMQSMSEAIKHGSYAQLEILRPFISMSKTAITQLAQQLQVPLERTYSCYRGGEKHCGNCSTCRERQDAFQSAGLPDPTVYKS